MRLLPAFTDGVINTIGWQRLPGDPDWVKRAGSDVSVFWCRHCRPALARAFNSSTADRMNFDGVTCTFADYPHEPSCLVPLAQACAAAGEP